MKILPRWLNAIVRWTQLRDVQGKHFFYRLLCRYFTGYCVRYELDNRNFYAPVDEWCFWTEGHPLSYYADEIFPFLECINQAGQPFVFWDLGADIGVVSSLVASQCSQLRQVNAFEPNPGSFRILSANLSQLNVIARDVNQAISDFHGHASFTFRHGQTIDHEGCIHPSGKERVEVTSLDHWIAENAIAEVPLHVLKIDVEGQEIQVFEGARNLLKDAEEVIVLLEIHPEVIARDGLDAEALFAAAEKSREFDWYVPLHQMQKVNRKRPFFQQFNQQQYDVIGISRPIKSNHE